MVQGYTRVNVSIPLTLTLDDTGHPGTFTYDNQDFFPINGQGFGNQGFQGNYAFTFELHTQFTYLNGQDFTFRGDDDVWVFVNDHLALDIGGVHGAETASLDLDSSAGSLGLLTGHSYDLDVFFAERHTVHSSYRIDTSIPLRQDPPQPPPQAPEPGTVLLFGLGVLCLMMQRRLKQRGCARDGRFSGIGSCCESLP